MCGVIGIYGNNYISSELYNGLMTLQHRGQDATGMITYSNRFHSKKGMGLARDVFSKKHLIHLKGNVGIGHTRYSTIGGGGALDAQPFMMQTPFGITMAHNGNLFNSRELKKELFEEDKMMINSDCDCEVLLGLFADGLLRQNIGKELKPEHLWKAVEEVFDRAKGAYSVVAYIADKGMIAFRDPHGIRPLVWGKRESDLQTEYCFSSEKVTLDTLGFKFIGDIRNGEAIFIDKDRKIHRKVIRQKVLSPSIFEYIYLARPDSVMNGISVYHARMNLGKALADHIKKAKIKIDVIIPVPDSGRTAALEIAKKLKISYREGLIKNRYIGRTFIMPGQKMRREAIRYKLNPVPEEIKGRNVLLVDDSIVRGNTSKQIVNMVREAGARKVYLGIFSPPITHPDVYGIDIPTFDELIAHHYSIPEICKYLNADGLYYITIKEAFEACRSLNPKIKKFDMATFTGEYATGDVTKEVLGMTAACRNKEKCAVIEEEAGLLRKPEKTKDQLTLV